MRMIFKLSFVMFGVFLMSLTLAQHDTETPPEIITAENVMRLVSIQQIDFEPAEMFNSGWFTLSTNGERIGAITKDGGMNVYQADGVMTYNFAFDVPRPVLEADFALSGSVLAALHVETFSDYMLSYHNRENDVFEVFALQSEQFTPAAMWLTCEDTEACLIWIEANPNGMGEPIVARIPLNELEAGQLLPLDDYIALPYGPATDPQAVVRIGRIRAPYAVTSSEEGLVKRWDLETGEVTAQAQVENGPAVFGQLSADGNHLVWRDPASENLYLLNFETGENRLVTDLNGDYVQYFLLNNHADMVFAVNIEDEPVLVAWIVQTGERLDLGAYRECGRTPDMARLSEDGTTLVIGCDLGLEVWRIQD